MAPLLTALATVMAWLLVLAPAWAITAPELRSQRSLQDLQPNMHGRNLQQAEFLKASLAGFDFSDSDLRGAMVGLRDGNGSAITTDRGPGFFQTPDSGIVRGR